MYGQNKISGVEICPMLKEIARHYTSLVYRSVGNTRSVLKRIAFEILSVEHSMELYRQDMNLQLCDCGAALYPTEPQSPVEERPRCDA